MDALKTDLHNRLQTSLVGLQTQDQNLLYCSKTVLRMLSMNARELGAYLSGQAERNPCLEMLSTASYYEDTLENIAAAEDYRGELRLQIPPNLPSVLQKAVEALISGLDNYGYLPFDPLSGGSYEQKVLLKSALRLLQAMEPAGIGARSLRECYHLQVQRNPGDHRPELSALLKDKQLFALYLRGDRKGLMERTGWSEAVLQAMTRGLNRLSMHPVETAAPVACAIPEARILRLPQGEFQVELIEEALPRVGLSGAYLDSRGRGGGSFANQGMYYARRLLFCLENRHRVFLDILRFAVVHQKQYLNGGALMQLTMREAAETLSIHPSTVSRTVENKYVEFEGKVFCAAALFDRSGKDGLSKGLICQRLQVLWQEEGPMSDQKAADRLLERDGIRISRRTVNKYRHESCEKD